MKLREKANILCLLHILIEYTDENHILSIREIIQIFIDKYDICPDRRTIYNLIAILKEFGCDISDYEENGVGYHLKHRLFETSEIRLLMDAVYSFPFITAKQTEDLIEKLQILLSVHERKRFKHLTVSKPFTKTSNRQVFWNIEQLDAAISVKRKVRFTYLSYNLDKKLVPRRKEAYIVNPYGMVFTNENYYLICIKENKDNVSLYRIDRIRDIEITDCGLDPRGNGFDPKEFVEQAFVVLARAIKLEPAESVIRTFSDTAEISVWAKGYIFALVNGGYIQGSGGMLRPKASITRAEFAQVMYNLISQYINEEGEYTEVAEGNVMVNAPGVTLKGLTVKGDLIIGDGVGDGDVTLEDVTVTGRMVVRGGGENSIIIRGNSNVSNVIVSRVDGAVRVKVEGDAEVEVIVVDDGSDDIIIEGTVGSVEVKGNVTVTAANANIGSVTVAETAEAAKIVVDENSRVENVEVKAPNAEINVEGTINHVTTAAANTTVTGTGSVSKVEVKQGADGTKVDTPKTRIAVDEGVSGVTAGGGKEVQGGTTVQNNEDGTDVVTPPPTGGGVYVPPVIPVNAVSVEGVGVAGSTLTAKTTPTNATVTYQWQIADDKGDEYEDIEGATEKTYTLTEDDQDKWIRVKVTGKGSYSGTVYSEPVQVVTAYLSTVEYKAEIAGTIGWTRFAGTIQVADGVQDVKAYYIFEITAGSIEGVPQYWDYQKNEWADFAEVDEGKYRFGPSGGFPLTQDLPFNGQTEFQAKISDSITVKAYLVKAEESKAVISNVLTLTLSADTELTEQLIALKAINDYLRTKEYSGIIKGDVDDLKDELETLGLYTEAYQSLDKSGTGGKERHTAVFKDLWENGRGFAVGDGYGGYVDYDLEKFKAYFNAIVATRLVTEASFDLVNDIENPISDTSYVTMLLDRFREADEVYDIHSQKLISERIAELEDLVERFSNLSKSAQNEVLAAVTEGAPYARSSDTTKALADALKEYGIVPVFSMALDGKAVVVKEENGGVNVGDLELSAELADLVIGLLEKVNGKTLYAIGVTLKVYTESTRNVLVKVGERPAGVTYYMYDTNKSEFIDTDVWGPSAGFPVKDEKYKTGVTTPVFFTLDGEVEGGLTFTVELVDVEKGIVYGEQELTVTIPEAENGNENGGD